MKTSVPRQAICLAFLFFTASITAFSQPRLDSLGITVTGPSREYSFTNKQTAFLYGETNNQNHGSWQGFNVYGHSFLSDYVLVVDGRMLNRATATVTVFPDYLVRTYPDGIVEEVHPVDSVALFAVHVISTRTAVRIDFIPFFTDIHGASDAVIGDTAGTALLARERHLRRTEHENFPVWLAIHGDGFALDRTETRQKYRYSPFSITAGPRKRHTIAIAVADTREGALALAAGYERKQKAYATARRLRMERLLGDSDFWTSDIRFNLALEWAKLSLDALIMNQGTHGIFAGLPWFNNYWGRDTFISLPGAALVTGRFAEARDLLRSFAAYQQTDTRTTDYGRLPNIITPTDTAYNTADATPRFTIMAKEYVERSGDTAFAREIYPVIQRAMVGTMLHHRDSLSLLTHGDAETWMDAVGPDGAWSPRGNRANDIQALWLRQLDAASWFAYRNGDASNSEIWDRIRNECLKNFRRVFFDKLGKRVYDHLKPNGVPSLEIRPNQIFVAPLMETAVRAGIVRTVLTQLTYPYGVASLSQEDDNFHPYHQNEPFYPKDAAYHNGTVWTWLQGPLISELCEFDKQDVAYALTQNSVHQILDRGAVGTQSELLDAVPRPGAAEPALSGTFSQAWNLAEFIRNYYDDYVGVKFDRSLNTFTLRPHLPHSIDSMHVRVNAGDGWVPVQTRIDSETSWLTIDWKDRADVVDALIELPTPDGKKIRSRFEIPPQSVIEAWVQNDHISVLANNQPLLHTSTHVIPMTMDSIPGPSPFVTPVIRPGLKALRGPGYPLLDNAAVKAFNTRATVLVDASDSVGDDHGTGLYTYPQNAAFVPGSFDITRFTVSADSVNAYFSLSFKALSDPGWHPEYGFQLTYVAIAVDKDSTAGSGNRTVGHNALYTLGEKLAYERLILVGGGVQVEDSSGRILAAYRPVPGDEANPLGSAETGTIDFAIPLKYLGTPSKRWTYTVLAGAQDDHGGSGLGEFRTVNRDAGEWNGGGRIEPDEPNVYDVLIAK